MIRCDATLALAEQHDITAAFTAHAGERVRLSLQYRVPEELDGVTRHPIDTTEIDRRLDEAVAWWERWSTRIRLSGPDAPGVSGRRSR